jgi:hypothetical protein
MAVQRLIDRAVGKRNAVSQCSLNIHQMFIKLLSKYLINLIGYLHPQGQGQMRKIECAARWVFLIPKDINNYPWIAMLCLGKHKHIAPYPDKLPEELMDSLSGIISRINNPSLTLCKYLSNIYQLLVEYLLIIKASFLQHPDLKDFCAQYKKATLQEIHVAFAHQDRISALIRKHRALHYPLGSSRLGVAYEYSIRHKNNPEGVSIY